MKLQLKKQKGFTMIELVIVISILTILAAFGLPRFANLSDDANKAVAASIMGNLNTSLGIARSKYYSEGNTGAATIDLDGNSETTDDLVVFTTGANLSTNQLSNATVCTQMVNTLLTNYSTINNLRISSLGSSRCTINVNGIEIILRASGASYT